MFLFVLVASAACDDAQSEAEGAEERQIEAEADPDAAADEAAAAEAAANTPVGLAGLPPLDELSPEDRLVVLASEPVPWQRLGELAVSLFDARHSLHRIEGGGPVIDFGHPSAAKFVQGRWKAPWLDAETITEEEALADNVPSLANRRVVWNEGAGASVRFPLPEDLDQVEDYELLVRMRPKVNTRMEVHLNEHGTIGVIDLQPNRWQTARLRIPAKQLRFGDENTLQLLFAGSYFVDGLGQTRVAAKFDWLRLVPSSQVENYADRPPSDDLAVEDARILKTAWRSLGLTAPSRLDTYQVIPDHARLRMFVAPAPRSQTPPRLVVSLRTDGQDGGKVLFDEPLEPGTPWRPLEFDLSEQAGQAARLSFVVEPGAQGSTGDAPAVWVGEPSLVIVRPEDQIGQAMDLGGGAGDKDAGAEGKNQRGDDVDDAGNGSSLDRIVVVAIDALRADRVAPEAGATHPATPTISKLANAGVRLEAIAQGSGSIAPTVSLLTGAYADSHEVYDSTTHLRQSFVTLGDIFDEAGWETAMLSTDPFVSLERGYAQGFDRYRNLVEEQGPARTSRLIDAGVRIVKKESNRPRMMYMQVGGLRLPHMPGDEARAQFYSGAYAGSISVEAMMNPAVIQTPLGEGDRQYLNALYDAELFEIDALFADLMAALAETGDMERTLVVVVGVHGEPLGEDKELGYDNRPTNAELRVPMVFYWPGHLTSGRRPGELVEQVDLLPTIARLAGLEIPETAQGGSLIKVLDGRHDNTASAAFAVRQDTHRSVTWGRYHYLLRTGDNDLFYDLEQDGLVLEDRTEQQPLARRALRDALGMHLAWAGGLWRKSTYGTAIAPRRSFAAAALERGW